MDKGYRIQWTTQKVEKETHKVMEALCIDTMPSVNEMNMVLGDSSLANKVLKTVGLYTWAKKLSIEIKSSETKIGNDYEELATELLTKKRYKVIKMSTRYPYDLLVNKNIKVDVKVGKAYISKGTRVHTIGINKKYATCDIYLIFALNKKDEIEKTLIIPSTELKLTSLNFGKESKYDKYLDRWDYLEKYTHLFKQLIK